jgi:putative (di)nucleoside polyphosphate hydrolase
MPAAKGAFGGPSHGTLARQARPDPRYRRGVGIVLIDARGHVFIGRRNDVTGTHWQMPQGGVDAGERARQAALRELREETGTSKVRVLAVSRSWLAYDFPPELLATAWGGQYRGQTQKWFAMRFEGADADIDIETDEPEFVEWRWVRPVRLPGLIVPFKRKLYEAVLDEFAAYLGSRRPGVRPRRGRAKARGRG